LQLEYEIRSFVICFLPTSFLEVRSNEVVSFHLADTRTGEEEESVQGGRGGRRGGERGGGGRKRGEGGEFEGFGSAGGVAQDPRHVFVGEAEEGLMGGRGGGREGGREEWLVGRREGGE